MKRVALLATGSRWFCEILHKFLGTPAFTVFQYAAGLSEALAGSDEFSGSRRVELEHVKMVSNRDTCTNCLCQCGSLGAIEVPRNTAVWIVAVDGHEGEIYPVLA